MLTRLMRVLGASAAISGALAATASAAAYYGPPPPKSSNGHPVEVVATGLGTPTSFAFGNGVVYEGDGGAQSPSGPPGRGGLYFLKKGNSTELPNDPDFVGGLVFHAGVLYVSAAYVNKTTGAPSKCQIQAWSGWTGKLFKTHKVIYSAPKGCPGFNGLAYSNGRIYAGVDVSLSQGNDHGPARAPYQYDILSLKTNGKNLKIYAKGIRQPWQLAFSGSTLYSTDLGPDQTKDTPPDLLLKVRDGSNFGFPKCDWAKLKPCRGYNHPLQLFKPHTDIGGLGIAGGKIYLTRFGMGSAPASVVYLPLKGGKVKTLLSGFSPGSFTIGLGINNGYVYVGTTLGIIYRVHL